jgi:hypothetical protein
MCAAASGPSRGSPVLTFTRIAMRLELGRTRNGSILFTSPVLNCGDKRPIRASASAWMPGSRIWNQHNQRVFNGILRNDPMHAVIPACQSAMRSRTRSGSACQPPAMPNGRCRLHGGGRQDLRGGIERAQHGRYTEKAMAERRKTAEAVRLIRTIAAIVRLSGID